ncbi:urease accessory protein UreG [Aerococcus urinaehominis]|uniref:Urease accessory protein UreG n=1 Tax=Aerococcus urinaehominis TaxID=128944 RepID=A0A0X8FNJ8_9LACT|nr:urease accessory protein UreG [Aerococcus urinaehominis]AMB99937.1 urease accessory protein UreG [Aerococcus urinaehominis]SDM42751.1 urease accessory protein [Aerococcus urinaehominis]
MDAIRIGVGGPVGAGKTFLIEQLVKELKNDISIAVVTNDIYTKEDANYLINTGVLEANRIVGVETGGCPHTAIREDPSMNEAAIEDLEAAFPDVELIFVESGGDNLAATFSPELVDLSIYIIDVAQGEKIPRKGGQGMIKSDLFIINKIDLAPHVHADLSIMESDAKKYRGDKPTIFTNLQDHTGLEQVIDWVRKHAVIGDKNGD